jgi:hypothetical protein
MGVTDSTFYMYLDKDPFLVEYYMESWLLIFILIADANRNINILFLLLISY